MTASILAHEAVNPLSGVPQEDHHHEPNQDNLHGVPVVQKENPHGEQHGHAPPAGQGNVENMAAAPAGDLPVAGHGHHGERNEQPGAPSHHSIDTNAVHDVE